MNIIKRETPTIVEGSLTNFLNMVNLIGGLDALLRPAASSLHALIPKRRSLK